jgi:hypothetical protein
VVPELVAKKYDGTLQTDRHAPLVVDHDLASLTFRRRALERVGARYASTAGSLSEHQRGLLAATLAGLPPGMTVALAFDRDPAGDRLAEQVRAFGGRQFSRDRPPVGKDWNEYLQLRERENVRVLGPARGQSRGR